MFAIVSERRINERLLLIVKGIGAVLGLHVCCECNVSVWMVCRACYICKLQLWRELDTGKNIG